MGNDQLAQIAELVEQAVSDIVTSGETLTYDLVGEEAASTTSEVGDAVLARFKELLD